MTFHRSTFYTKTSRVPSFYKTMEDSLVVKVSSSFTSGISLLLLTGSNRRKSEFITVPLEMRLESDERIGPKCILLKYMIFAGH